MQDRNLNNALLALERDDGIRGNLARALFMIRELRIPDVRQLRRLRRGHTRRMVLAMLETGPKTTRQIADHIHKTHPDMTDKSAYNRAYQCLNKLREIEAVMYYGCLWGLIQ
ncbi:hypothetical protein N9491_02110 [Planktomarina temperata]|nr:hypothetical protein [Planktomarina temperata]